MVTGTDRREGAQDTLATQTGVEPVLLQSGGVRGARAATLPDVSLGGRIAQGLSEWSGTKISEGAQIQYHKDVLDGQMAQQQGKALDDVSMKGNKWALEGYMLMDSQTISSSMLAAQREAIRQGGYALGPDEYREGFVGQMDSLLEGKDPRTAELVRTQMGEQMPTLVGEHTTQHLAYQETRNFDSLERSIDIISRDPTATDQLVLFAQGGEGSPSDGLSEERRNSAVVAGVERAFENDNPLAYSALASAGLLGENLSTAEIGRIKAAKSAFESRRRSEYDEALFSGEQELLTLVENGEKTPDEAVKALSLLYADHDITISAVDAGEIYGMAEEGVATAIRTRGVLMDEAELRGDTDAQAAIIIDSLTGTESGGNSKARRTNDDGRSFGGLLQMGQGRLDDWSSANGTPPMTVAEFTALPAAAQAGINQWHIKDLIGAAKATGAIGTKINGVTVTLSGLVAVAHLGGSGGMREFVRTGGAYNPQDQLGTSLSDYLSSHGGGAMDEMFTPAQRAANAEARYNQTAEQIALEKYGAVAPAIAALDDQFKNNQLTKQQWMTGRDKQFQDYDLARTKADVDAEIRVGREVEANLTAQRDAAAKTAEGEAKVAAMDDATRQLVAPEAAYNAVMDNPASTPAEIKAASAAFLAEREAVYNTLGIPQSARGNGAAFKDVGTKVVGAIKAHVKHSKDGAEIAAAVKGGYLGELSAPLRGRAFQEAKAGIVKKYTDAVAAGQLNDEQAQFGIGQDINKFFAQSGFVDPTVAKAMSAAMLGPLLDKNGNPNPRVVDSVTQYLDVKSQNPGLASKFLDPEAQVLAEAIASRATGPDQIAEAVQNLGVELSGNRRVEDTALYMQRTDVQEEINREALFFVQERDIGLLHSLWQGDAEFSQIWDRNDTSDDLIRAEETQAMVAEGVSSELARLHKINPNLKPRDLAALAAENFSARADIIGGDLVVLAPGVDINAMVFGNKAAEFGSQDSAVNSAIANWMRSDEAIEQHGVLGQGSTFSEYLPSFVQGGIDNLGNNVEAVGLGGWDFQPGLSIWDTASSGLTGLRPFRSYATADGKGVVAEVLLPSGNYSEPIVIPLKRAGELYMGAIKSGILD